MNFLVKIIITLFVFSSQLTLAQSPGGVSAGRSLWYRADVGTSCNTDNCLIDSWGESFASGNNASQPTPAERPRFYAATPELNFNPAIEFSGSQELAIENLNYTDQNLSHVYVWVVFKTDFNTGTLASNWAFIDFDRSEFFNFYAEPDTGTIGWSFTNLSLIHI